jgi:hypothetical protein
MFEHFRAGKVIKTPNSPLEVGESISSPFVPSSHTINDKKQRPSCLGGQTWVNFSATELNGLEGRDSGRPNLEVAAAATAAGGGERDRH